MIGLLFLIIMGFWFYLMRFFARIVTNKIHNPWCKTLVKFVLIIGLMLLPFLDEILASQQFEKLCRENNKIWMDKNAKGKTVYLYSAEDTDVKGTWVHVTEKSWKYVDVITKKVLVKYSSFDAGAGIFYRTFKSSSPLLFKGSCFPVDEPYSVEKFLNYGMHYIESPNV